MGLGSDEEIGGALVGTDWTELEWVSAGTRNLGAGHERAGDPRRGCPDGVRKGIHELGAPTIGCTAELKMEWYLRFEAARSESVLEPGHHQGVNQSDAEARGGEFAESRRNVRCEDHARGDLIGIQHPVDEATDVRIGREAKKGKSIEILRLDVALRRQWMRGCHHADKRKAQERLEDEVRVVDTSADQPYVELSCDQPVQDQLGIECKYGAKDLFVVIQEICRDALDERAREGGHYANRESSLFFASDRNDGIVELSDPGKNAFHLMIKPHAVLGRREAPLDPIKKPQPRIEFQIGNESAYCRLRNIQQLRGTAGRAVFDNSLESFYLPQIDVSRHTMTRSYRLRRVSSWTVEGNPLLSSYARGSA